MTFQNDIDGFSGSMVQMGSQGQWYRWVHRVNGTDGFSGSMVNGTDGFSGSMIQMGSQGQ